jgi:hypothetical protein
MPWYILFRAVARMVFNAVLWVYLLYGVTCYGISNLLERHKG